MSVLVKALVFVALAFAVITACALDSSAISVE